MLVKGADDVTGWEVCHFLMLKAFMQFPALQAVVDYSVDQAFPPDNPETSCPNPPVGEMTALVFNFFVALGGDKSRRMVVSRQDKRMSLFVRLIAPF